MRDLECSRNSTQILYCCHHRLATGWGRYNCTVAGWIKDFSHSLNALRQWHSIFLVAYYWRLEKVVEGVLHFLLRRRCALMGWGWSMKRVKLIKSLLSLWERMSNYTIVISKEKLKDHYVNFILSMISLNNVFSQGFFFL